MEGEPARQQRDLDRHDRHRIPGHDPVQGQQDAGKHVAAFGAAARPDRLSRPDHVRRIRRIADHFQGEISFHAGARVVGAVMEQRPAAVRALLAAKVAADTRFQRRVGRLAQRVHHQHVLGRDGGIRFQFVDPVPVRPLLGQDRPQRALDSLLETAAARLMRDTACARRPHMQCPER
jgi:hypothetical protein